jgi:hypothetical protein
VVIWLSLIVALGLAGPSPDDPRPRAEPDEVTLSGRVVELAAALQRRGLEADPKPIAGQVALEGEDGTILPLLSTAASRAFFLDERLRGRPTEIVGYRYPGVPYLEVITFRVEEQGDLRTPEYHCDVCEISTRYPQVCPCCQGPMELRYRPAPQGR